MPDIRAYTRETHGFAALGGYRFAGYELSGAGEPAQVNASRMTAGVFRRSALHRSLAVSSPQRKPSTASRSRF